MNSPPKESDLRLGFLTALDLSDHGTVAGLLVTNRFSRPLEFQCTTPVKPNRTQQLLYGPTLRPFLLGELLTRPLVEKVGVKPHVIFTDQPEVLGLREFVSVPVVHVTDAPDSSVSDSSSADAAGAGGDRTEPLAPDAGGPSVPAEAVGLRFRRQWLRVDAAHAPDRPLLERLVRMLPEQLDLREPLERVREALKEATAALTGAGRP